ncbi:MAG: phosphonate metabolism transcriptional regulator PhnF [Planctomycetota bacterium]|nr:phosphonate metabolism transcriptional regulator PhnF [Planctomycetota bacterium]MCX8039510.1 phosphonate metabolism transcriptional regulator PhnF [Planctomycetota bacterium]MDW8373030.1 phosphonate metabolism transcriptional regulator PhnF [Planctomycetota bacterium]
MITPHSSLVSPSPRAVYAQIAERLSAELRALPAGTRLPPEHRLAARFGVNRHTLRHAVDVLEQQGLVERRRGLGTFVLEAPLAYPLHAQARFTDNLAAAGRARSSRLLEAAVMPASAEVAQALRVDAESEVWRLLTLRQVDEAPMSVIEHWLPLARFPALASVYRGGSLHALLANRYGARPRRRRTAISAQLPLPTIARLLRCGPRQPVLRLRTLNVHADDGKPIEYAISWIRADRIELLVEHEIAP